MSAARVSRFTTGALSLVPRLASVDQPRGLLLTGLAPGTSVARLMTAYVTFGIGTGLVNAPITNTAVSGMPRSQAGVAAAIASTSRQIGQ